LSRNAKYSNLGHVERGVDGVEGIKSRPGRFNDGTHTNTRKRNRFQVVGDLSNQRLWIVNWAKPDRVLKAARRESDTDRIDDENHEVHERIELG
jgi:hypothetical protein